MRGDLRHHRIAIGDQLVGDVLQLRLLAEIQRVGNELDGIAALPALVFERPDTDRQGVVRRIVDVGQIAEQMFRKERRGAAGRREIRRDESAVWLFQMQNDRRFVRCIDVRDLIEALGTARIILGIHHRSDREPDVVRREWHAVGPLRIGVEVIGDRLAVFGDTAVFLRWNDHREFRDCLVLFVVPDQMRHRHLRKISEHRLLVQHRVEADQIFRARIA